MKQLVIAMVIITFHCSYALFVVVIFSQHSLGYDQLLGSIVGITVLLAVAWGCWEVEQIRHLAAGAGKYVNDMYNQLSSS